MHARFQVTKFGVAPLISSCQSAYPEQNVLRSVFLTVQGHYILTQHYFRLMPVRDGSVSWASIPKALHINKSFVSALIFPSAVGKVQIYPFPVPAIWKVLHTPCIACLPSGTGRNPPLSRRLKFCAHIRYSTSTSAQEKLHNTGQCPRPHSFSPIR